MDHLELYGRLRASLLSRRFAYNGSWRVNFPSNFGTLVGVASRADYDRLTPAERLDRRWSDASFERENPWALAGASLATALAVESHFGHAHARAVLGSLLESAGRQFRFSGEFAGYPVRWDPMCTPPNRWRNEAAEPHAPMYSMEFGVTSGQHDFANAPRDFRRHPRRRPDTLRNLLGRLLPPDPDAMYEGDLDFHRRWEISQDEIFGMLAGLFAIHHVSGDAALRDGARSLLEALADYLSRNAYLLVKPERGIVGRGGGDSLVGSEYALGRMFHAVLGADFASRVDWQGAMTRAGYWEGLEGPILESQLLLVLAALAMPLAALTPAIPILGTIASLAAGSALATVGPVAAGIASVDLTGCPDLAVALLDPLLPARLAKVAAVVAHNDVFDPFRERDRNDLAQSLFFHEYDRATRFRIYSQVCALLPSDAAPQGFMAWTGLIGLDDDDPMLQAEFRRWFTLITAPLGALPRGLPPSHRLLTLAVACLRLGNAHDEVVLRDALDAAKAEFENHHDADLALTPDHKDPATGAMTGLRETCDSASDYMAGLALAWLHAHRRLAVGATLPDGFPTPPADFSVLPRPTTRAGEDLFPGDQPVPRTPEPPVRLSAPADTSAVPAIDRTVVVSASDGEVDTGIMVHYGDTFRITASGTIWPGWFTGTNGPDGNGINHDARWPLHSGIDPDATRWSLLARLNGWFAVGADSGERRWLYDRLDDHGDAAQRLYLRINDNEPGDGGGSFTARVRLWGTGGLQFEGLEALGHAWVLPPTLRFALRCRERCGPPRVTISVRMPDASWAPIVGAGVGGGTPVPDVLDGPIVDHAATVNPSSRTTVFWLGEVQGGVSQFGRNDTFSFRLSAHTDDGYLGDAECSARIEWHGEPVSCVRRTPPGAPRRILAIGGVMADGRHWVLGEAQAIAEIERGQAFFVERPAGDRVRVAVVNAPGGDRYLRTAADGDEPNNLLALPNCPG